MQSTTQKNNEAVLLAHAQKQALYQAFEPFYTCGADYQQDLFDIVTAAVDELPLPLSLDGFGAVLVLGSAFSRCFEEMEERARERANRST